MRILKRSTSFATVISLLLLVGAALGQSPVKVASPCPLHAGQTLASITASGALEVIPVPTGITIPLFQGATSVGSAGSPHIEICHVSFSIVQTTGAADYGLVFGTGANCVTGKTNLTPQWFGTASVKEVRDLNYSTAPIVVPAGKAVCINLSAAPTGAKVFVTYTVVTGP